MNAQIVGSDLIVYSTYDSQRLLAQRFDPDRLTLQGTPVPLGDARNSNGGVASPSRPGRCWSWHRSAARHSVPRWPAEPKPR